MVSNARDTPEEEMMNFSPIQMSPSLLKEKERKRRLAIIHPWECNLWPNLKTVLEWDKNMNSKAWLARWLHAARRQNRTTRSCYLTRPICREKSHLNKIPGWGKSGKGLISDFTYSKAFSWSLKLPDSAIFPKWIALHVSRKYGHRSPKRQKFTWKRDLVPI